MTLHVPLAEKSEINVCRENESCEYETLEKRVSIVVKLMDASFSEKKIE